jgi:cobalt-zinc-cadmium efflux system outer membrane protein
MTVWVMAPHCRTVPVSAEIRVMFCIGWLALLLSCATASAQAPASQPVRALTLDAAIDRALSANPAAAAARLRHAVAAAGIDVSRERPNPEARIEIERETPHEAFSFALPVETAGKRRSRVAVGEAALRTSDAEQAQVLAVVRADVRLAYATQLIAELRLALQRELVTLAARVREAARARFEAGGAPRLDVVQAQLAVAEAENQLVAVEGEAVAARTRLNALLAYPLDASIALATPLDAITKPPLAHALEVARSSNAELAVLDRRLDEQRARVTLARAMQRPDLIPEVAVTHGNAPDFNIGWRAAVGVTVPLFTRHHAGVVVEEATLSQLSAERAALLARIGSEVTSSYALADAEHRQYLRYRDEIVPQALEVERMADDSYRLGQTGLAAYLQALQSTRDARLRALQVAADFQAALSEMERAMGAPLP